MAENAKGPGTLNLETKRLCLDFANTADWHASDHPKEQLNSYADLVSWAVHVDALRDHEAQQLLREAERRASDAAAALEQAIVLREAIYRIFSAAAHGRPPEAGDIAILNVVVSEALGRLQIIQSARHFVWSWSGDKTALDRMLWPVARSAADLITSKELERVGQCADDRGCGWLFLDMSRNRSRRWCDMRDCGNRAKARRHYQRKTDKRDLKSS